MGLLCLSPSRSFCFWIPLGSNLRVSGLFVGPLGSDLLAFWVPFWSLLAPFGSLWFPSLAPFWFPLAFHWFTFGSLVALCCSLRVSLCRPLAPRRLPGAETYRKQLVEYILNTSTMFVSIKANVIFINSKKRHGLVEA